MQLKRPNAISRVLPFSFPSSDVRHYCAHCDQIGSEFGHVGYLYVFAIIFELVATRIYELDELTKYIEIQNFPRFLSTDFIWPLTKTYLRTLSVLRNYTAMSREKFEFLSFF